MSLSRRKFIELSSVLTASTAFAVSGCAPKDKDDLQENKTLPQVSQSPITCVRTICGNCHNNCGVIARVQDGVVIGLEGDPDHPYNKGAICSKGQAFLDVLYSPDRLQYPMKRTGERGTDTWERISWDEAYTIISTRLQELKEEYGPQTLLYDVGAPVQNVVFTIFKELWARYGSPNTVGSANLCFVPRAMVLGTTYGFRDEEDYDNTDLIINWGANPAASLRPGAFKAFNKHGTFSTILDAKERGVPFIVIDPVFTETAAKATDWIPIKPATDQAFGLAMINVIINEDLYDHEFVEKYCDGFEPLKGFIQQYPPQWAERICGVPADKITEVARAYATTKRAIIHEGNNFALHDTVAYQIHVIGILRAITGHLDREGTNCCYLPNITRDAGGVLFNPTVTPEAPHVNVSRYPLLIPGMPGALEAIETGEPYTPRSLFVYHANPLQTQAGRDRMLDLYGRLDFIVVSDLFYTETARALADVILPDTTWLERFDYRIYSENEGAVVSLRQPVIEPLYDIPDIYSVERTLADKLGVGEGYPWQDQKEFISYLLKPIGITTEQLIKDPVYHVPGYSYEQFESGKMRPDNQPGFPTRNGKIGLFNGAFKGNGYEPLPVYIPCAGTPEGSPEVAKDFPLVGINRRNAFYVHTKYHNNPYLREAHPEPLVYLNPIDANARGVEDGSLVSVSSPLGSTKFTLQITERVQPGSAWLDGCWGEPNDHEESRMNTLIDMTQCDPVTQSPNIESFLMEVSKL